jgi:hypothetical protein
MRWLPICAICGSHLLPPYVGEEEACCGDIFMYRNQRSLRRTWWRLFLTTLSSVARVVRWWYAQCLISPSLQNSATLRHFFSGSAAVLEQARVRLQNKRSKLNARHISLVAFASCSFASLLSFWVFIVVPRGGICKQGCSERLRAKAGGGESLAHTNRCCNVQGLLRRNGPRQSRCSW